MSTRSEYKSTKDLYVREGPITMAKLYGIEMDVIRHMQCDFPKSVSNLRFNRERYIWGAVEGEEVMDVSFEERVEHMMWLLNTSRTIAEKRVKNEEKKLIEKGKIFMIRSDEIDEFIRLFQKRIQCVDLPDWETETGQEWLNRVLTAINGTVSMVKVILDGRRPNHESIKMLRPDWDYGQNVIIATVAVMLRHRVKEKAEVILREIVNSKESIFEALETSLRGNGIVHITAKDMDKYIYVPKGIPLSYLT